MFENYQRNIHHESGSDISRSGFQRFLCTSPLKNSTTASGTKFGSFHQCYRIDGRLVAMSVLDLLPHSVSAVYFIYHEDYAKWSFGKLSACREAALALEGGYRYYYMGAFLLFSPPCPAPSPSPPPPVHRVWTSSKTFIDAFNRLLYPKLPKDVV